MNRPRTFSDIGKVCRHAPTNTNKKGTQHALFQLFVKNS